MTLDAEDIEAIANLTVERTVERLRALGVTAAPSASSAEPPVTVGIDAVMEMVGAKNRRTAHRALNELGVKPWRRGKYRWHDVYNAIARKSMTKKKAAAKADQDSKEGA